MIYYNIFDYNVSKDWIHLHCEVLWSNFSASSSRWSCWCFVVYVFLLLGIESGPRRIRRCFSPFPNKITDLDRFRHAFGCFEFPKPTILGFLQVRTSHVEWYQVMAIHGHHWATFEVAQINGRWTSPKQGTIRKSWTSPAKVVSICIF